jgi:fatty acid desaturase
MTNSTQNLVGAEIRTSRAQRSGSELQSQLKEAGCFKEAPIHQISHMLVVLILFATAYTILLMQPTTGVQIAALVALAFSSVQAGFIAHEAGHGALTKKRWLAELIGQFYLTFLTGLCYSHFQKIHTCHHSRCNEREKDLDLQSTVFSLYPGAAVEKRSLVSRFITRHQGCLIWPLVSLQGLTLKIDSINTLRASPKSTRIDQLVLLFHFLIWVGPPAYFLGLTQAVVNYAVMTWMIGPYLGSIFIVNHIGTRVFSPQDKPSRFTQTLLATRNLGDSKAADIFFGGLNNHIEHHLFPTMPTVRLRKTRGIVRNYCKRNGLIYREMGWWSAAKEVSIYLKRIARTAD